MVSPKSYLLCIMLIFLMHSLCQAEDAGLKLMSDALEWPSAAAMSSMYGGEMLGDEEEDDGGVGGSTRRSLFWHKVYYISYGALSANRIPCPPRSGRSYYTHNCYKASGPVQPYSRGCSAITRCRR